MQHLHCSRSRVQLMPHHFSKHMDSKLIYLLMMLMAVSATATGCDTTRNLAGRPSRVELVNRDMDSLSDDELYLVLVETAYTLPSDKSPSEAFAALNNLGNASRVVQLAEEFQHLGQFDGLGKEELRNAYARRFIDLIDAHFDVMLDDMVTQRKGFDASTDILAVALDTVAVIVTPASTKSILAGLSAITIAGRTAIDKAYFYEQTLPVLIATMQADRQKVMAEILTGLSTPDTVYGLTRLKRDLSRYIHAGTIDGALSEISRQAGRDAEAAEFQLENLTEEAKKNVALASRMQELFANDTVRFDIARVLCKRWWATIRAGAADEREIMAISIYSAGLTTGVTMAAYKDAAFPSVDALDPAKFDALLDSLDQTKETDRQFLAEIITISEIRIPGS